MMTSNLYNYWSVFPRLTPCKKESSLRVCSFLSSNMVPTWFQHGSNMVPTWFQHGSNMVATHGSNMVPTWFQHGSNMVPTWYQHGSNMVPTWYQHGSDMVPANPFCSFTFKTKLQGYPQSMILQRRLQNYSVLFYKFTLTLFCQLN